MFLPSLWWVEPGIIFPKKIEKGQPCEPDLAGTRLSSPESIGLGI
jgi:hypothetical protein